ncbi:MAG TPA: branched-chain amino acid ABC transporter permease [Chloroflexia bacterium]|jgi:branched-chain amino acid transport system permease protein
MAEFYNNNSFLINLVGINAIMALSIYITLSCAMLSLSNAASMAIGAYTAALLTQQAGWPLWLAVVAAAAVAGLVALLLGMPILRLRGVFLAIATLGFGEVIRIIIVNTPALGGPEGFRLNAGNRSGVVTGLEIFGTLLVLAYFFARLKGSRMGLAMDAIREDENAARTMGINVTFYKVMAYVTGAVVAGIGGALYAHLRSFLSPGDFGFQRAVDILVFAVVGGTFAWRGAILGAALITLLPEITRSVPVVAGLNIKDHPEIFSGLILLLVILFLPKGLLTISLGLKLRRPAPRTLEKEASP